MWLVVLLVLLSDTPILIMVLFRILFSVTPTLPAVVDSVVITPFLVIPIPPVVVLVIAPPSVTPTLPVAKKEALLSDTKTSSHP